MHATTFPEPQCVCTWFEEPVEVPPFYMPMQEFEPVCFEHGEPGETWLDPMIQGQCSQDFPPANTANPFAF